MEPSVLVRIGRVLGKTHALIEAATLTENAEDAYEKFWRRMEKPFQRVEAEDSDAYFRFANAYENFRQERDTMPAIVLDLKDIGYPFPEVVETQYTAVEAEPGHWAEAYRWAFEQLHPDESERAEALAKIQKHEEETHWRPPGLLENLGDLEQALLKARSAVLTALAGDREMMPLKMATKLFGFESGKTLTCFLDRHPEVEQDRPLTRAGKPHQRRRRVDVLALCKAISRTDAIISDPERRARMESRLKKAQLNKELEAKALAYLTGKAK